MYMATSDSTREAMVRYEDDCRVASANAFINVTYTPVSVGELFVTGELVRVRKIGDIVAKKVC